MFVLAADSERLEAESVEDEEHTCYRVDDVEVQVAAIGNVDQVAGLHDDVLSRVFTGFKFDEVGFDYEEVLWPTGHRSEDLDF